MQESRGSAFPVTGDPGVFSCKSPKDPLGKIPARVTVLQHWWNKRIQYPIAGTEVKIVFGFLFSASMETPKSP